MNIGSDDKKHIAQYLSFLLSGEKIAHNCSAQQARICEDDNVRRFFIRQSRQEKFHATTFQSAILWLAPKGVVQPARHLMRQYESTLIEATDNNDLLSSVIGLQVILEGMGDVALSHFNEGFKQRGAGFQTLRRAILAQEDSHHNFGTRYLKQHNTTATPVHIYDYLPLINELLDELQGLFEFFDEDAEVYKDEFNNILPQWVHDNAVRHHSCA